VNKATRPTVKASVDEVFVTVKIMQPELLLAIPHKLISDEKVVMFMGSMHETRQLLAT
jgi:ketopantoate reductase